MVHVNQTDKILRKIYKHPGIRLNRIFKFEKNKNSFDAFFVLLDFSDNGLCYILDEEKSESIKIDKATQNYFVVSGNWKVYCTWKGVEYVESKIRDFYRWIIPICCTSILSLLSVAVSAAALIVTIMRAR